VCAVTHTEADAAIAAVSEVLGEVSGEPVALEGGITNRNFRVVVGGRDVVVRVPGKDTSELGIDRAAEAQAAQAAARLGLGPPVAAVIEDPRCIATEFVPGETMSAESLQGDREVIGVASILRTLHESGEAIQTDFDPFEVIRDHGERAVARGASLPPEYEEADRLAREIRIKLTSPLHDPVFTHNDLLPANLIRSSDGALHLLDWDYAGMGNRFFDLANFAINAGLSEHHRDLLLSSYFGEVTEANRATLNLMRVMSDFREAMWGVLQGSLSDLDFDFSDYAAQHFRRLIETSREPAFSAAIEAESVA
jgi:thiamine kinase-like enzyme